MQNKQEIPDNLLVSENGDRRRRVRIYDPFPAMVRGVDASGATFLSRTIIDNISTDGVYLRLMRATRAPNKGLYRRPALQRRGGGRAPDATASRGEVVRVEPRLGGACGFAVSIKNNRFV